VSEVGKRTPQRLPLLFASALGDHPCPAEALGQLNRRQRRCRQHLFAYPHTGPSMRASRSVAGYLIGPVPLLGEIAGRLLRLPAPASRSVGVEPELVVEMGDGLELLVTRR
jgi:hypothetical protein